MSTKTIRFEIPFQRLLEIIDSLSLDEKLLIKKRLTQDKPVSKSILEIEGLGAELWQGIDVADYIRKERQSWD
ncbi:MAG: hypothetical protein N2738_02850 [Thermodesulfovibrionales bacterium]|nr:hypothetical protein [Thermodesulfovibrionales bacterium]